MKKAIVLLSLAVIIMLFVSRSRVHHEELSDAAQVQITNKPEPVAQQPAEVVVPTSVETNTPAVTNVVKPRKVTIVIDPKLASAPQK